jgi:hypothetical protein
VTKAFEFYGLDPDEDPEEIAWIVHNEFARRALSSIEEAIHDAGRRNGASELLMAEAAVLAQLAHAFEVGRAG